MDALTRDELALLALSDLPGVGPAGLWSVVARFGGPGAAFDALRGAPVERLVEASGDAVRASERTASALATLSTCRVEAELADARRLGLRIAIRGAAGYPAPLEDLTTLRPPFLFLQGRDWPDWNRCVAIVGTRRSTAYGRAVAHRLARDLARWGWSVVSGMARGIDAAAHAGALDGGGHTLGVLGSGHEHEYPRSNRALYARMRAGGGLVSEFWPSVGPDRHRFPRRNRIIAALARAVVVVEAGERSGALNTVKHATDLGREILAVPGRVDAPASRGVIGLLRNGAAPVAEVRDIFDAVGWVHDYASPDEALGAGRTGPPPRAGREEDARVLRALVGQGLTADEAAAEARLDIGPALAALGRLEVDGRVVRGPGGRFELAEREARA